MIAPAERAIMTTFIESQLGPASRGAFPCPYPALFLVAATTWSLVSPVRTVLPLSTIIEHAQHVQAVLR